MTQVYDNKEDRSSKYHKTLDLIEDQRKELKSKKFADVDQNI